MVNVKLIKSHEHEREKLSAGQVIAVNEVQAQFLIDHQIAVAIKPKHVSNAGKQRENK